MKIILEKGKVIFYLLGHARKGLLLREIGRRLYSNEVYYGLHPDLRNYFKPLEENLSLRMRPLSNVDIPKLLDLDIKHGGYQEIRDRVERLLFIKAGISTCYVAVTHDSNQPCFMQWLIGPEENRNLGAYFKVGIPLLAEGEMLFEFAFIPEKWRGRKIIPIAMALVAEEGKRRGAQWGITFVRDNNIPSLRGCLRAGFTPYMVRRIKRRLFVRRVTFTPLTAEFVDRFSKGL